MMRTRGRASPSADSWVRPAEGVLSCDDAWSGGSGSGSGSDSAYGTVDESDPPVVPLRRRSSGGKGKARLRSALSRTRSASVGWPRVPTLNREGLFALDLDFTLDGSSTEDLSAASSPSTLSVASSRRSSPEPSECDFFADTPGASPHSSDLDKSSLIFSPRPPPSYLARRHTLPRGKRVRSASISLAFVSPPTSPVPTRTHPTELISAIDTLSSLPPATLAATVLTATLSLASRVGPIRLLPASPVHLLRVRDHPAVETVNAILSPFLVSASSTALGLGVANLVSLKSLEERGSTGAEMAGLWGAILAVRVTLAWVFGRVLGWAHPSLFSTQAIHQVGAGLAPLLLALHIVAAYRRPSSDSSPISFQVALLAANFSTPIEHGGTGFWWGASAVAVGLAVCAGLFVFQRSAALLSGKNYAGRGTSEPLPATAFARFAPLASLLVLPFLASHSASAPASYVDASFATLHPEQPNLLTILLMTAPRPGNPDFLIQTIESWLGALPHPTSSPTPSDDLTERLRLIVYTHFQTHDLFDAAQRHFTTSPAYAAKTAQYVEWHRDPRGSNRLDQRLHVARGLDYASHAGGESAYVLLAEDDFPLCPNANGYSNGVVDSWTETWAGLKRAFVETNDQLPDFPTSPSSLVGYDAQEASSGHCGLFLATGGSGLALRGFVAARLPALLLGAADSDGSARDARASAVRKEDEGADTPDLVIQDCLRGRIKGCEACAPDPTRAWPVGSRRNAGEALGDRWGKSGLAGTERLMQRHLGYNASTLPGRRYGKEEWACGWRQPFNGEPDVLTV